MRFSWLLASAWLAAAPAMGAPSFVASNGTPSFSAAQCSDKQDGDQPVTSVIGCSRDDVGSVAGTSIASFGHLGAFAQSSSHTGNSLGTGIGSEARFQDTVIFTSTNPNATTADVSANLLLHGIMDFHVDQGAAGDSVEGAVTLNQAFFFFRFFNNSLDGFSVEQNPFAVNGTLGPTTNAVLTTPLVTVALNTPIILQLRLQSSASTGGMAVAATDFGGSFKFVTGSDAFNLPDGVTVNAGTWLVDNRFIDPLAAVPEPASWALMIAGFGLVGSAARRRKLLLA
ncbi:PEPxxWA-CTERM sorting domain-containing protein [Sphingomonas tabacisoli]|uniref:PEPxxWA-CTERM sorting domain-containing protein n=1 Tax=Sphingomonas tabacisoli TaxID=2249466 RepID=A0ABW4I5Y1_9SPHN